MRFAQVVSAYPDRGLCVAWLDGVVIRRRRLQAREDPRGDAWTDWSAVRVEAERVAGRLVVIPRLGESVPEGCPADCDGSCRSIWCSAFLAKRGAKATARRTAARKGAGKR